ncbi:peptide alpha-N-acetyltransferase subunit [Saccharomycopsis crataegensis]|uniref:Peptide alpha-N-acetyltransferase subunit n=1 Tax=Saccharomycopsis crataegensis TaxID=43959 RepID=A0AAV5QLA0_9ASCO|nr:peptide alpha-N-acetyltransferase subunit [Saccharomycopsis crataegensis]
MPFKIALDDLTPNNLGVIEKINSVCLPVQFDHQWYKESLEENQGHLVKYAFFNELPVAAIKARVITKKGHASPSFVYIDSIAVLEAYRGYGIGKKLLDWLVEESKTRFIHKIQCHGWKESVDWYVKQGFTNEGEVKGYYEKQGLTGDDANAALLSLEF